MDASTRQELRKRQRKINWHGDCLTICMGISQKSDIGERIEQGESERVGAPEGRLSALLAVLLKYAAHAGKYAADSATYCSEQKPSDAPPKRQSSD